MFARLLLLLAPIASLGCGINNNCGQFNPFGCAKDDGADNFGTTVVMPGTTGAPTTSSSTSTSTTSETTTHGSSSTTTPVDPTTAAETTTTSDVTTTTTESSTTAESTETASSTSDTSTTSESTMPPMCGDGTVNGNDECDDMGDSPSCDADCTLAVCNDGYLNMAAGEECYDGNGDPKDSCDNECHIVERRVFVTSIPYSSALGGLQGADNICQGLADGKKLGGNYKAWLSTGGIGKQSPSTRFNDAGFTGRYVLVSGAKVADGWADLIDGSLGSKINRSEDINDEGLVAASVWTNTKADGTDFSTSDCGGWLLGGGTTTTGSSSALDGKWTANASQQGCGGTKRLYCFEVP